MINFSRLSGQTFIVMGLARSGMATAEALHNSGVRVYAWDDNPQQRNTAKAKGITLRDPQNFKDTLDWANIDGLILTPGIPHRYPQPHPVAAAAQKAGVAILCDIEMCAQACPDVPTIGITGSNGKSTTTALLGHILKAAEKNVQVGGNLGQPVAEFSHPADGQEDLHVLELSSYQLERTPSLHCHIAILLNITPAHLERHGGMAGYIAAKRQIFQNQGTHQGRHDTAVINIDTPNCWEVYNALMAEENQTGRHVCPFSTQQQVSGGIYVEGQTLIDNLENTAKPIINLKKTPNLQGDHNAQNAAAAYAAARLMGVPPTTIANSFMSFSGLAHRQEHLGQINGISFVNDSKATDVESAAKALSYFSEIYWILGGKLSQEEGPKNILAQTEEHWPNVRHAFVIGEAADAFEQSLQGHIPTQNCGDLNQAIHTAWQQAMADNIKNPTILLSPACASFDQFADFEARGDAMRDIVNTLKISCQAESRHL